MSDKLQQQIGNLYEFVDGEKPSAWKFNSLIDQIRASGRTYESAIGDLMSQSWPYTSDPPNQSNTYLTIPYGRRQSQDAPVANTPAAGRPLDIVNLGRLIGPVSYTHLRAHET